ncbi:MAG: hypothetical protein M1115_02390, partial [Actinobacteria bacterium]|nr:hypothetical protein [Actinomycetota bacterium]
MVDGPMPSDPSRKAHYAWEPQIAVGPSGELWAIGDSCDGFVQEGICQVDTADFPKQPPATMLWRSTNGGRSWSFVSDPMRMVGGLSDLPAGYDSDVAVATAPEGNHPPLIYVVSNWAGSIELAISEDNGHSWVTSSLNGFVATDRPWLAASGPCTLYMSIHPLTGAFDVASEPVVAKYNGCQILAAAKAGQSIAIPKRVTPVEPLTQDVAATDQDFAKLRIVGSSIYQPYVTCDSDPATNLSCNGRADVETLAVAVSHNEGASFEDVPVATGHMGINLNDGTWPLSLAVDSHGLAVIVADTGYSLWTFVSHNSGMSWKERLPIDAGLHWSFAGVPSVAASNTSYSVGWYASPPAVPNHSQRWFLATALVQGNAAPTITVLPTELATTPYNTPLADTLSES